MSSKVTRNLASCRRRAAARPAQGAYAAVCRGTGRGGARPRRRGAGGLVQSSPNAGQDLIDRPARQPVIALVEQVLGRPVRQDDAARSHRCRSRRRDPGQHGLGEAAALFHCCRRPSARGVGRELAGHAVECAAWSRTNSSVPARPPARLPEIAATHPFGREDQPSDRPHSVGWPGRGQSRPRRTAAGSATIMKIRAEVIWMPMLTKRTPVLGHDRLGTLHKAQDLGVHEPADGNR